MMPSSCGQLQTLIFRIGKIPEHPAVFGEAKCLDEKFPGDNDNNLARVASGFDAFAEAAQVDAVQHSARTPPRRGEVNFAATLKEEFT